MMTGPQRVRSLVDKLRKKDALRPPVPTGTVNRLSDELVNTSANARAQAAMSVKKPKESAGIMSLADLIKRARQT